MLTNYNTRICFYPFYYLYFNTIDDCIMNLSLIENSFDVITKNKVKLTKKSYVNNIYILKNIIYYAYIILKQTINTSIRYELCMEIQ